jgi:ParB-like chromosome segregation protein Spo0J
MTVFEESLNQVIEVHPADLKFVCNMRDTSGSLKLYSGIEASLSRDGILYPLIANLNGELVDGHCRLAYAKDKGLQSVPVLVKDVPTNEIPLYQYRSFDRQDAGSIGVALALQNYVELNRDKTNQEIADLFGVSTATVSHALSIERKVPELKPLIRAGKITPSTAKVIAQSLPEIEERSWEQSAIINQIAEFVESRDSNKPINNKAINNHLKASGKSLESVSVNSTTIQPKREKKLNVNEMVQMIAKSMSVVEDDGENVVITALIPKALHQILSQIADKENRLYWYPEPVQLGEIIYKQTDIDFSAASTTKNFFDEMRVNDQGALFGEVNGKLVCDSITYFAIDTSSQDSFKKLPLLDLFIVSKEDKILDIIKRSFETTTIYQTVIPSIEPVASSIVEEPANTFEDEYVKPAVVTEEPKTRKPKAKKGKETPVAPTPKSREHLIEEMIAEEMNSIAEITDEELEALLAEDLVESVELDVPSGSNLLNQYLEELVEQENPEYEEA